MSRLCVLNCPNNYDMAPIIKHWHEIIKLGKSYYRHSGGSSLQNENHFRFRSRSVFISYHFYQFTLITCGPALIKCFFIRLIWPKEECTHTKIRSVFYVSTFFFFRGTKQTCLNFNSRNFSLSWNKENRRRRDYITNNTVNTAA